MYKNINVEIIGFIGNMGSGKNYIAENIFLPNLPPKRSLVVAFADYFKLTAICFQGLNYQKVFGEKDEITRKKLQELGTEYGRDKYGDNIWCDILYNTMKMYAERGIERFIITDIRFENEVKFIKELKGIIIKIVAPDRTLLRLKKESNNDEDKIKELSNHRSETYIKNFIDYDYYVNNSFEYSESLNTIINSIIKKIY